MKKTILVLATFVASISFAQVNQYDALKVIPEGTLFKGFHTVKKKADGSFSAGKYDSKFKIEHHNSMFDKLYAMKMVKEDETKEAYEFRGPATNHYTQPSIIGGSKTSGYVILGDVVYRLQKINDKENPTSFSIKSVYIRVQEKEEGKKLSMKERLAKAKEAMDYPKALKEPDHKAVLNEYFASMAKLQANTKLTAQEQKELDAIIKAENDLVANINSRNAEWENTEGKRIREINARDNGQKGDIIIINNTGSSVCLVRAGASITLLNNNKRDFWCSDIYYGEWDGSSCTTNKKSLLVSENDCGKTVTLD